MGTKVVAVSGARQIGEKAQAWTCERKKDGDNLEGGNGTPRVVALWNEGAARQQGRS